MTKSTKPKFDLYQTVTDRIVAALEAGVRPWQKSWAGEGGMAAPLRVTGVPYKGLNVWLLALTAMERGYTAPHWMTYAQASKLGGQVRKGEKSSMVFFFAPITKTGNNAVTGDTETSQFWMSRLSFVFNVEQIDGLPERFYPKPVVEIDPARAALQRIENAEQYFEKIGATVKHGGNRAFYSISQDFVMLPEFQAFRDAASYYATKAHEYGHWTGHESRLNREFGKRFGDEAYAVEELVAEMSAAFVCANLGIESEVREDHASYLAHWIKVMKADKKAIFTASREAQKAAEFLNKLAGVAEVEPDAEIAELVKYEAKEAA